MHLVEDEVVAVVVPLAQLCLQLVEVDGSVVARLLLFLLSKHVLSLFLRILDAPLARFPVVVAPTHPVVAALSHPFHNRGSLGRLSF